MGQGQHVFCTFDQVAYDLKKDVFHFQLCVCICMCAHEYTCLIRPEEKGGSPGGRGGYELPHVDARN